MKTNPRFTMRSLMDRFCLKVSPGILFVFLFTTGMVSAQQEQSGSAIPQDQQQRLDLMKAKGIHASLTILPARLFGNPFDRVSEVIGVILEQQGLKNIELCKTAFNRTAGTGLREMADSVGRFVQGLSVATDYVLYAEMNGDGQEHSIDELIGIVTDRTGAVVWTDILNSGNEAFRKVDDPDPAGFSVLLCQRLGPVMGLNEETARNARPGRMAAIMNERSGLPPDSERAPLPARQKILKESLKKATLVVFPVRVDGKEDRSGAEGMVRLINNAGLCRASVSKESLLLKSPRQDPNELKKLWDLAREFRDYARKNPAGAGYLLYADFDMPGYVHFVVCDHTGEWVIADFQNSGHSDFRNFNTSTVEGCNGLVVRRMQHYVQTAVSDVIRETIRKSGTEAARTKFKELRSNMEGFCLSEEEMNALGYEYMFSKQYREAIAVFQMNVEAFPDSWNTYDSLGEAYAAAGDTEQAVRNYEKSVELNPHSPSGIEALKKLKGK